MRISFLSRTNNDSVQNELLPALYRSSVQKTMDAVASICRHIPYVLTVLYHRVHSNPQQCGQKIEWKPNSHGLVVLLHGLRNDPAAWYPQLSSLRNQDNIDIFAPVVPKRGMCSLEEAALPILPTLMDYANKHPGKPLCLLGVSNGSRLAIWLETQLRKKAPSTPVLVSTIAGVHLGSSRMNLLEKLHLAKYFYPYALEQELRYNSHKARELLSQVQEALPSGCAPRSYEFYASTEDFSVPDLNSSLPQIGKGEQFHILHGHSHDSIVKAVAKKQIQTCLKWINKLEI